MGTARSCQGTVVPAPAGVVRQDIRRRLHLLRRPRARGGGPTGDALAPEPVESSPRPRGWSAAGGLPAASSRVVPAPAGVVRPTSKTAKPRSGRPRARGGGPPERAPVPQPETSSPRPRGWSGNRGRDGTGLVVVPAPAGVVRPGLTSGPAHSSSSPRPRGWSQHQKAEAAQVRVVPAPAGVVRPRRSTATTRGRRPRARGGGPALGRRARPAAGSSPRPRGWSGVLAQVNVGHQVVPAPAGVVRFSVHQIVLSIRRPRARGGGP